jgi:hypothetical protein
MCYYCGIKAATPTLTASNIFDTMDKIFNKILLISIIYFFSTNNTFSQNSLNVFIVDPIYHNIDCYNYIQNKKGNIILLNEIPISSSSRKLTIISLDSTGHNKWAKIYNCSIYPMLNCRRIFELDDGYFIGGIILNTNLSFLAKIDTLGNIQWAKSYNIQGAYDFAKDKDDNVYLSGLLYISNQYECKLLKVDKNGQILWARVFGTPELEWLPNCNISSDGGLIYSATTYSVDSLSQNIHDMIVVKFDSLGNQLWSYIYNLDSTTQSSCTSYSITTLKDGGYIIHSDFTSSSFSDLMPTLTRINENGDIIWSKVFSGEDSGPLKNIFENYKKEIIFSFGESTAPYNAILVKIDSSGSIIDQKSYNVNDTSYVTLNWILPIESIDSGIIALSPRWPFYNSDIGDMFLFKIDSGLNSSCGDSLISTNVTPLLNYRRLPFSVCDTFPASTIPFAIQASDHNYQFAYGCTNDNTSLNNIDSISIYYSIFPNPAYDLINISSKSFEKTTLLIKIYDLLGNMILEKRFEKNMDQQCIELNINSLNSGLYFICINNISDNSSTLFKFIKY